MTKIKNLFTTSLVIALLVVSLGLAGCGLSDEQIAELDALRTEVTSLGQEVNSLKSEKTQLERELAEMQSKLDKCAQDKETTQMNLEKLGL
jgi:uncharacterized protein (DUF3084 family)